MQHDILQHSTLVCALVHTAHYNSLLFKVLAPMVSTV